MFLSAFTACSECVNTVMCMFWAQVHFNADIFLRTPFSQNLFVELLPYPKLHFYVVLIRLFIRLSNIIKADMAIRSKYGYIVALISRYKFARDGKKITPKKRKKITIDPSF